MLFPFIFISSKSKIKKNSQFTYDQILNHEKIHFVQCLETFIIGFYIIYLFEIICNYMKYGNLWDAYINVRFEKEASPLLSLLSIAGLPFSTYVDDECVIFD